ncbi:hypothetical protein MTO96_000776 [Rhipicephalus appendiculatus]
MSVHTRIYRSHRNRDYLRRPPTCVGFGRNTDKGDSAEKIKLGHHVTHRKRLARPRIWTLLIYRFQCRAAAPSAAASLIDDP